MADPIPGHVHPLTQIIAEPVAIFRELGFAVAEGPEIETDFYNFDALNIPADHPARDMWDTFWLKPKAAGYLLRTHTSPVQVRYMQEHQPPLRIIAPGKVFRYEATDATHEAQFYQLEGLVVDRDVSLAQLKHTLDYFLKRLFGPEAKTRFRPSYFPFVEPGVEVDMSCHLCGGQPGTACSLCKGTGWIEIMGAGLVHPSVFTAVGYAPGTWTGFAFGVGVDRLALLKYGIDDIRLLYSRSPSFLNQF